MGGRKSIHPKKSSDSERLGDAINYLQDFMQRHKNRLTLQNLSLAKRYVCGDIAIHIRYRPSVGFYAHDQTEWCAVFQENKPGINFRNNLNPSLSVQRNVWGKLDDVFLVSGGSQNRNLMFISDADFIEAKEFFPNLVILDRMNNIRSGPLMGLFYGLESGFQFIGAPHNGEIFFSRNEKPPRPGLIPNDVESGAQIVNDIGGNSGETGGDDMTAFNNEPQFPVFRIELTDRLIRVSIQKCAATAFKLSDVLFGPFDFSAPTECPIPHYRVSPRLRTNPPIREALAADAL